MKIGITLTSSLHVGQEYIDLSKHISKILAESNFGIVYGGTDYGMMAELANGYKEAGGKDLTGVMSRELEVVTKGYKANEKLDKAIWVEKIGDRIRTVMDNSDGFIILPGGYGTLEEITAIVGGKANKLFDKPIVIVNFKNFYDKFLEFLDEMQQKEFSKIAIRDLVHVVENTEDIINYFNNYSVSVIPDKFL